MARFDKELGIVLNEEEKETFKRLASNVSGKNSRTPIADSIMKKILPKQLINNQIKQ